MARGRLRVKVAGVKELQQALQEKRDEIWDALRDSAVKASEIVEADAKRRVPKGLTQELGMSIKKEVHTISEAGGRIVTGVTVNAEDDKGRARAAFTELGTSDSPMQPFMRPALYDNKGIIRALFSRNIKAVINK